MAPEPWESSQAVDFQTDPSRYRHWRIERDGDISYLIMDVDPAGGLSDSYELKLNSYDLAVDIELNDAVQRLRFEYPEVHCIVLIQQGDLLCAAADLRHARQGNTPVAKAFSTSSPTTRWRSRCRRRQPDTMSSTVILWRSSNWRWLRSRHLVDDRHSTVLPITVLAVYNGSTRVTDKRKYSANHMVSASTREGLVVQSSGLAIH